MLPDNKHPADSQAVTVLWFWACAILGTSLGGSLFGIIGGPVGMFFGFFIAIAVGLPIQGSALLLTLVGPLAHFRFAISILAGGLTGVFSALTIFGNDPTPILTAAFLGSATTYVTLKWFFAKTRLGERFRESNQETRRFTLADFFIFLTIVAALCGGWSLAASNRILNSPIAIDDSNPGQLPPAQLNADN